MIGTSDVPNTPVSYTLNGTTGSANVSTDANGGYSFYVTDVVNGANTLTVEIKNAAGTVLSASSPLTFSVSKGDANVSLLQSFFVQPE